MVVSTSALPPPLLCRAGPGVRWQVQYLLPQCSLVYTVCIHKMCNGLNPTPQVDLCVQWQVDTSSGLPCGALFFIPSSWACCVFNRCIKWRQIVIWASSNCGCHWFYGFSKKLKCLMVYLFPLVRVLRRYMPAAWTDSSPLQQPGPRCLHLFKRISHAVLVLKRCRRGICGDSGTRSYGRPGMVSCCP